MNRPTYTAHMVVDRDDTYDPHDWCPPLDRRSALRLLTMTALAGVAGCSTAGTAASSSGSSTTAAASGTATTSTVLTPSSTSVSTGSSLTLTAAVSPSAASGTVTFYNGSTSLGSVNLAAGSAVMTASFSTAGTEALKAVYNGDTAYAGSTSSTVSVLVSGSAACAETLEGEEGPYFVDDSASGYKRSNILTNLDGTETQTGVPFTLALYVYDASNGCAAMQNVQVDIWHCNAAGIYSAESSEGTSSKSWLRGYQLTDASGMVTFNTILPGWYSGRTTHIHLRLRSTYDASSTGATNTMQVFFDQTLIDTLDTTVSPYASEGKNPTTNAADRVYAQQERGTTLMTLAGSTAAGYTATARAYLPIA